MTKESVQIQAFVSFNLMSTVAGRLLQGGSSNSTTVGDVAEPNDASVLRDTFFVYGIALVVILFIFCVVHRRYPRAFTVRRWAEQIRVSWFGLFFYYNVDTDPWIFFLKI